MLLFQSVVLVLLQSTLLALLITVNLSRLDMFDDKRELTNHWGCRRKIHK